MDPISRFLMTYVIDGAAQLIMPLMLVAFLGGIVFRFSIYYLLHAQRRFALEFERRVRTYHGDPSMPKVGSFSRVLRGLLVKTHAETVDVKRKQARFSREYVEGLIDRLFMVNQGVLRLIQDLLYQSRYLRKKSGDDSAKAKLFDLVRGSHETNPYYNRLFGVLPTGLLHDLLNALPALFVIGGIFGTFLGIAKSLPELGGMDLTNAAGTKATMDAFLVAISQAMIKSIVGIGFSIVMTLVNTLLNLDGVFVQTLNRFTDSVEQLWVESENNELDSAELEAFGVPLTKVGETAERKAS